MNAQKTSAQVTLWVNRFVFLTLAAMVIFLPQMLQWYTRYRYLTESAHIAVMAAMYCCAVFAAVALWNMDCLLRNIIKSKIFIRPNVTRIHNIQWCCGSIALVSLPAVIFYLPLIFLTVIMAFMCLIMWVVSNVMDAAVAIREENDLTI